MFDKILSQDDKTGFAVQLYLAFKKQQSIIGNFKSIIGSSLGPV